MAKQECVGCGGIYQPIQGDGSTYFHVCPPAIVVTLAALDGSEHERALEQLAGVELVPDRATYDRRILEGALPAQLAIEKSRRQAARAGHRDENTLRREGERGEIRVLRSEGAGARPRPDLDRGPGG